MNMADKNEPRFDAQNGVKVESAAELELLGNRLVPSQILAVEIIQQAAALADHHEQTAAGAVIFHIALEMLGEVVNPFGQKGDLHIRGAGVLLMRLEAVYCLTFVHSSLFDQNYLN